MNILTAGEQKESSDESPVDDNLPKGEKEAHGDHKPDIDTPPETSEEVKKDKW